MFRELGQMANLLKQLPKLRERMEDLRQRLGQLTAEGDAGAGMVKVRVNGRMELLACTLSDEALRLQDRELLEDLIVAAANQALGRVRERVLEETSKFAGDLGLPPGFQLPDVI
ncbi:MAG: YbaB/EbfC family nucleoid-associated protein [Gemmataceae bacterium]|nr:YbaB/EbfC family nucleoid-associated protein [Gemmataceae bacterium]MDW8266541.1 YbaB/EbfC family nucleoid-associated protein [Gemmataceae bacterium]